LLETQYINELLPQSYDSTPPSSPSLLSTSLPYTTLFRSPLEDGGPRPPHPQACASGICQAEGSNATDWESSARNVFPLAAGRAKDRKSTSLLQSPDHLVCRLLLEKKKAKKRVLETKLAKM